MRRLNNSQKVAKRSARKPASPDQVLAGVVELLDLARRASARVVNSLMTATYWEIGRRIVEYEQVGQRRAAYGEELIHRLSVGLTAQFGRGFGVVQLSLMRQFFVTFKSLDIFQSPIEKSGGAAKSGAAMQIFQSPIEKSLSPRLAISSPGNRSLERLAQIAHALPLPWTHYVRLLRLRNPLARAFYAREALAGGWSVRQLDRHINAQLYERSALSRNKALMLLKGQKVLPGDVLSADEEIRDPLILEFLNLKDEYSENDLEGALVQHLETFLLELGDDFTFVARQRRLRIGHQWFRVDLLFFHRRLRCLVLVDLKIGALSHADIGQMNLYCNYARAHWVKPEECPPVGLILCTDKDDALAHYATEGLGNKMLIREYLTTLPKESALAAELARTRELWVRRAAKREKSPEIK